VLTPGDRAPNFLVPGDPGQMRMFYNEVTGRPVVLLVYARAEAPAAAAALAGLAARAAAFRAAGADLFLLTAESPERAAATAARHGLEARPFCDPRGDGVGHYLAVGSGGRAEAATLLLDGNQRVLAAPFDAAAGDQAGHALEALARWPGTRRTGARLHNPAPPVLMLPDVLEPDVCARLIRLWHEAGHEEGGVSARYGNALDAARKRSLDHTVTDPETVRLVSETLARRIGPELQKTFCWFAPFAFDGHVILSYDADRRDFFGAHRDNLAPGTQTRRFAMSLNLNDDYDGGELWFPEYGPDLYRPEVGMAAVFSCSVLHEALPVSRGRRWTLTTFFREARPPQPAAPAGGRR